MFWPLSASIDRPRFAQLARHGDGRSNTMFGKPKQRICVATTTSSSPTKSNTISPNSGNHLATAFWQEKSA
jgi:hypothetical protein